MHSRQGAAASTPSQHILLTPLELLEQSLHVALPAQPSALLFQQQHCRGCCSCVPDEVFAALDCAYPEGLLVSREDLATLISPLMAIAGWRFCSCYRKGVTHEHAFLYRLVDTVCANQAADWRDKKYRGGL